MGVGEGVSEEEGREREGERGERGSGSWRGRLTKIVQGLFTYHTVLSFCWALDNFSRSGVKFCVIRESRAVLVIYSIAAVALQSVQT